MIKCAALLFICPSKILCIPHQTANSIFMDSAILCSVSNPRASDSGIRCL